MPRQTKTARYRRVRQKTVTKTNSLVTLIRFIIIIFVFALGLLIFVFFKVATLDKFTYLNKTNDDGAEIIIIDSQNDKLVKLLVPGEVMLDSAHGYGNYKLSSLWKLSEKDKIEGKLVSETILKNFLIPVPLWKNGNSSNLNLFQRIRAVLTEKKTKGYDGTIDSKKISNSILINFVNPTFIDNVPKIDINDLTGDVETATRVSRVVEIIGGKVTSNSKGYDENLDCEVYGGDVQEVRIFALVFDCIEKVEDLGSLDIKIRLGSKFSERF